MSENLDLVKNYLMDLELQIIHEDEAEELLIVQDDSVGVHNLVIDCEPPIVILEQLVMPVPEEPGDLYEWLLQTNNTRVRVHRLDRQSSEDRLSISGAPLQIQVSQDDDSVGRTDSRSLQGLFGHLAADKVEVVVIFRTCFEFGDNDDRSLPGPRISSDLSEYLVGLVVPATDDEVIFQLERTHPSVLFHLLFYQNSSDRGAEHPQYANPEEHHEHADHPSRAGAWREVAVSDRRHRDHAEPEGIPEGRIRFKKGKARSAQEHHDNDQDGKSVQIFPPHEVPELLEPDDVHRVPL